MRLIAVVLIWIVIIGGISLFMARQGRQILPTADPVETVAETATFFVELTLTFAAEKDPFALDVSDDVSDSGMVVKMGETLLPVSMDNMEKGVPFKAGPFTGAAGTTREVFVRASPPVDLTDTHNGIRIRIFEENTVLAERTLWAEPGQNITGTLQFTLSAFGKKDEHEH